MSNKRVNITLIIRDGGSTREVSAKCSENVAFALFMLQYVAEMPPTTPDAAPE